MRHERRNVHYVRVHDPEATFGFDEGWSAQHAWGCEELEVRYGEDDQLTVFFCPEAGVRDGSEGTNNGSDVAHLTLSRQERIALAAALLHGLRAS